MQRALQITVRNMQRSAAVEDYIESKIAKMEQFYSHIVGCHIDIEMPHKHKHQGRQFNVRIEVSVPGRQLIVNRDSHEDVYVALRDAFSSLQRQLEDYARRQRGHVKLRRSRMIVMQ